MGIGNSTLNGGLPRAWSDVWLQQSQRTSGSERQRAQPTDDLEEMEPEQEEPVPPVTAAQVHAFEEQRAAQWRGPDPAGLPPRWQGSAFLLLANVAQQAQHIRSSPNPPRLIRSVPEHLSHNVEQVPPAVSDSKQDGAVPALSVAVRAAAYADTGATPAAGATPARADTPGGLRYGSLDWADLQSGIDIATALGLDHRAMPYAELVALAQAADMAARLDPEAAAGLLVPQIRTALIFAGMSVQPDDLNAADGEARIDQAMRSLTEARSARWEVLQQRQRTLEALQAPIPTRHELAERILFDHGIHPDRIFLTPPLLGTPAVGGHVEPVADTARNLYLDGRRSLNGARLPDADKQFNQAFSEYKEKAQQAIALLYGEAILNLPEEDRIFWEEGKAQILMPEVREQHNVLQGPFIMRPIAVSLHPQAKPFSAIVAIKHDGQTRHYLAATASETGRLIQFLADDLPRDAGYSGRKARILNNALSPHIDDLFMEGGKIKAAEQPRWKLVSKGAQGPAASGIAKYFAQAIEKQRGQAYEPTTNQQALQRVRDGLLSMIPFYNCVTEVQAGNAGSAALSCAFDVVGLVPLAGTALKAGVGAGKLSIRVGSSALRQLAHTPARGLLSRQVLRKVIAEMAHAAPPAASLARDSGKALVQNSANLLDPGFQFAGAVGKGVLRGGQALTRRLRQSPGMQALADRIDAALKQKPFAGPEVFRAAPPHSLQEQKTLLSGYAVAPRQSLPEPDVNGIRSAGGKDYIRMNGEYYLVDRAPHDPVLRIYQPGHPGGFRIPVRQNALGEWESFSLKLQGGSPADDIEELWHFPESRRWPEFQREVGAAAALAPQPRHTQLMALTRQIKHLRQDQRGEAFDLLASQPDMLDKARLAALAEQIEYLDINQRLSKFNVLFEMSGKLSAGRPTVLIEQIEYLAPEQRRDAFDRLLGDAAKTDPQHRAAYLEKLGEQMRWLHRKDGWDGFDRIFSEIDLLPAQQRAAQLIKLARQSGYIPAGSNGYMRHSKRLDRILRKITAVPDEKQRAAHLKALTQDIGNFPEAMRMTVCIRVIVRIEKLSKEQRLARESSAALLSELDGQLHWLSTDGHNDRAIAGMQIIETARKLDLPLA